MERKVAVGRAEACDEVVLERSDRAFGGVATMNVWRNKLEVDVLAFHVGLEGRGSFVVETLELRFEAAGGEECVGSFVCGEDFGACFVFHWLDVYVIAVILVEDEHVAVAVGGGLEEAAGLVGEDFAGGGRVVGVDVVGSLCRRRDGGRVEVVEFFKFDEVGGSCSWVVGVGGRSWWCGCCSGGRIVGVFVVVGFGGL